MSGPSKKLREKNRKNSQKAVKSAEGFNTLGISIAFLNTFGIVAPLWLYECDTHAPIQQIGAHIMRLRQRHFQRVRTAEHRADHITCALHVDIITDDRLWTSLQKKQSEMRVSKQKRSALRTSLVLHQRHQK